MEKYHKNLSEDEKKKKIEKEIMLTIEIKIWWSLSWTKKIVALFNCVEEIEEFGLVCKFGEWGPILQVRNCEDNFKFCN